MSRTKRLEAINEAQEKLQEAITLLEEGCAGDTNAKAYLIDHLKIMAGSGHGFASRDLNLDELKDRVFDEEYEDEYGKDDDEEDR